MIIFIISKLIKNNSEKWLISDLSTNVKKYISTSFTKYISTSFNIDYRSI